MSDPDIEFTLGAAESGKSAGDELTRDIVLGIIEDGPAEWHWAQAQFALTVAAHRCRVRYLRDEQVVWDAMPSAELLAAVRRHRAAAAASPDGPWWRLVVRVGWNADSYADPEVELEFDYGTEPFPPDQMLPPEAYRADLAAHPRERIPVWLAAYLEHDGRQSRSPQLAALRARADRVAAVWPAPMLDELPDFPLMWTRWAVLAAAFVAAGSAWGPRLTCATGRFESARRSGSTLCVLPGGRGVLSGGVWDAEVLEAAYNGGDMLPDLYAGAPDWVSDAVLDPRAGAGLLTFCCWWEAGQWYRGESPPAREFAAAVPGVWTADTVAGMIARLADSSPNGQARAADGHALGAAAALVAAAESGVVSREMLTEVFGAGATVDLDGAMHQLDLTGVLAPVLEPLPRERAIARVRDEILADGRDLDGHSPEELVADRFDVGWLVYVPVPKGEIAIGRAVFAVTDDGALEQSSSSVAPSRFLAVVTERFHGRYAFGGASA